MSNVTDTAAGYGENPDDYQNVSVTNLNNTEEVLNKKITHTFACVLTILGLFGLCGNVIGATVLAKVQTTTPGVRLLKYLSCVDIAVLLLIFENQVLSFFSEKPRSMAIVINGLHSITFPLGLTVYTFEIYFTVLVACQRSFALAKPLLSSIYLRDSIINKLILTIACVSVVFNIPYWLLFKRKLYWDKEMDITWISHSDSEFSRSSFRKIYDGYITLVFRAIIPMTVLVVCNIVSIVSVRKPRISQSRRKNRDNLAAINIAIITMSIGTHVMTSVERILGTVTYLSEVTTLLIITDCSANFIFYCTFGGLFRKTLMAMCKKFYRPCRREAVADDNRL